MPLTGKEKRYYQREYMREYMRKKRTRKSGLNKGLNKSIDDGRAKARLVPGEGLEPTHLLRAEDFKSSASANSATPALMKLMEATSGCGPLNGGFADPCLTTWLRRPVSGAEDEARTRDLLLGKEAFYH